MSNDLKKLEKIFAGEPSVKPSEDARKAAHSAAMAAFDEQTSKSHQGNPIETRLKGQGNKLVDLLTFANWRKSMKLSYALAGGTSIAVLTLAVFNAGQFQQYINPGLSDADNKSVTELADANEKGAAKKFEVRQAKKDERAASQKLAGNKPADKEVLGRIAAAPQQPTAPSRARPDSALVTKNNIPQPISEPKLKVAKQLSKEMKMAQRAQPRGGDGIGSLFGGTSETVGKKRLSERDKRHSGLLYAPAPLEAEVAPATPPLGQRNRDKFEEVEVNQLKLTRKAPVSTFSIDVDTASYSFMRAAINRNVLPPKDAVRVEEMVNYFPYDYQRPENRTAPFKAHVSVIPSPWNTNTKLVHIGIKGFDIAKQEKPHSNLVFLLDTSGSMSAANKLPLLKNSFKLLLSNLAPDDTISIVAYAGSAGTVLAPTKARNANKILAALDRLQAGGSTAGGEGIRLAYQLAEANFDKEGVNRIILATDGDFNVGIRDKRQLKGFIERKRKSGVFLSILGFGMGNYNDALMQTLAQNGNGNASYIDNLSEARKVLVEESASTLFTIAKDVKIQMEFNPKAVSEYRLIGYETRQLKREDFNNDKVDAGDIGSGHTVTAIYEITPTNAAGKLVDPLRYNNQTISGNAVQQTEYGFLKLRYKLPNETKSKLIETPIKIADSLDGLEDASQDTRFAIAVAAYGQLLRGGKYTGSYSYDDVIKLASSAKGNDQFGYRSEFINLVRLARSAAKIKQGN